MMMEKVKQSFIYEALNGFSKKHAEQMVDDVSDAAFMCSLV